MKKLIIFLVAAACVLTTVTTTNAQTQPPPHFLPGSVVTLYDRTNDARATEAVHHAVSIWNGVGANFTLVYERGPADNECIGKQDVNLSIIPNTVGICTYPTGSNGNYASYPSFPLDGTSHTIHGFAGQCTDPPCAGLDEAKRILAHEIGHVIGVNQHTPNDSTGACSIMSVDCYSIYPNQNDRDLLIARYGHTHAPVVVAGNAWLTDGTKLRLGPANTNTTIRVYATNMVQGVSYKLVSGSGTASAPCSSNIFEANPNIVTAGSNGLIGTVSGNINRPVGDWQICFRAVDSSTVSAPVVYRAS